MPAADRATREFLMLQDALTGRYALERELGRGGMGIVYLAREVALERPVAIKLLQPQLAHEPALRERFLREARTAAQLTHPNIVPIHSVEAHDDLVWFVMAYVDGETLTERVARRGPIDPETAVRVMRDVSWALSYAHGRGVIHRDIKPDNILLEHDGGRALVADFGIARVASNDTLTDDGAFVGTVQYMSREQAGAEAVDGRSDLYSLGATIYFALTGESPVKGPTLPAMLARLATEESPNVLLARPDMPAPFATVLARAMARERDQRPASAEALTAELQSVDRSQPAGRPEVRAFLRDVHGYALVPTTAVIGVTMTLVAADAGLIERPGVAVGLTVVVGMLAMLWARIDSALKEFKLLGIPISEVVRSLHAEATEVERRATLWCAPLLKLPAPALKAAGMLYVLLGIGFAGMGVAASVKAHSVFLGLLTLPVAFFISGAGVLMLHGKEAVKERLAKINTRTKKFGVLHLVAWVLGRPFIVRKYGTGGVPGPRAGVSEIAPTATLLLQRVEDLVGQLPAETRARLPEIIPVGGTLERASSSLRKRLDQLDRALAELPAASPAREEFVAARNRTAARLADCITALDSVRTDLLRLSVGLGQADGLTLALEKAKELGAAIDAELHGMDEVRKIAP